ncbi:MAG TPA: hypothetical protein VFG86_13880, partial [Chloroflexota bacterium]|nr:hypothetical protein [Chloroflexota bacterium]
STKSAGDQKTSLKITTDFQEQGGQTVWTARLVYPTQAARDAVMQMGMEFERFDALLAALQTV